MTRQTRAAALTLVPTLLLAVGWLLASLHAHELSMEDREARLTRAVETIRAAIDESLEDLRGREDERPFYLYNRYYSPPNVIALTDPVALSPLSRLPSDARILGYFQVEPGGVVQTPYSDDGSEATGRERGVRRIVESPPFVEERTRSGRVPPSFRYAPRSTEGAMDDLEGPLTTNFRGWGNTVLQDIQGASAGYPDAEERVVRRGRSAPLTNRYNIVETPEVQPAAPAVQSARRRNGAGMSSAYGEEPPRYDTWDEDNGYRQQAQVQMVRRERDLRQEAPPAEEATARTQVDIDYKPMQWTFPGEEIALQRVVSHEDVPVVQGVLLDREYLFGDWLPQMVSRHADTDLGALLIDEDATAECSARGRASDVLPFDVCFPPSALSQLSQGFQRDLTLQLVILAGLLGFVLFALFAMLRATQQEAELAAQKSAFVSAVSHELRTPLTTIRMHAEMLDEGLVSGDRLPQVHDELVNESVRLARLVDNVLEVSRLEDGKRRLHPREADLSAHLGEVVSGQRRQLESKGYRLELDIPRDVTARFDAHAVEQIVVNLLDNAAKYGGADENVIGVILDAGGDMALLRIVDRGIGIPESLREEVFERFYRVETPASEHTPGTGIGLSLVRELARAQGGDASIHPRDGGGTEVHVQLPLA